MRRNAWRTSLLTMIPLVVLVRSGSTAQQTPEWHFYACVGNTAPERSDTDDPAFEAYKAGYNLILEERWDEARRTLDDVVARYRKSKYLDDAQYWSAYAQMHLNRKKAVEAYQRFLEAYPTSSYTDDAVADLERLKARPRIPPSVRDTMHIYLNGVEVPVIPNMKRVDSWSRRWHGGFSGFGPRFLSPMSMMASDAVWSSTLNTLLKSGKLDPATQLRIETLYTLGEMKEDGRTMQTLKEFAFDRHKPQELRIAAMGALTRFKWNEDNASLRTLRDAALDSGQLPDIRMYALYALSKFKKMDVLPVLSDIALNESNAEVQQAAIEAIGLYTRDREKSVDALIGLYDRTPAANTGRRRLILDVIGETRSDKALRFLTKIASDQDALSRPDHAEESLWEFAIDVIPQVSEDKNKTVVILSGIFSEIPKQRTGQLSSVMYRIANIGNDKAVDFFRKVARTHANYEVRSDAVYYLGNIGGERARTALFEILKEQ